MCSLTDHVIVLTGAGGGIGSAVARQLDAKGAKLILTDINADKVHELNAELREKHYPVIADLSTAAGRSELMDFCNELMQPLHTLINLAGINRFASLSAIPDAELERLIMVNLGSQIALCRDMLPLLLKQSRAEIVNVGSILGSIGMPGYSVYCATKFGLRGFSEALNRELMDSNVAVRYFAPRATQTSLNDTRVNEMNLALGNAMDSPETVASELVRFLENHSRQTYLGWPERLFVKINGLFPSLVDMSFRKQLGVIKRYL